MPLELARMLDTKELDDPEIVALKGQLMSLIATRGFVDTDDLIQQLGWDAESYWLIRRLLIKAGVLRADGKMGVKFERVTPATGQRESAAQSGVAPRGEKSLYAPIVETVRSSWVPEQGIEDYVIDVSSSQGRRVTGGKWSRPDITLASSKPYKYVPGRFLELRTFEVKTHDGLDVTAVYEALSHRRAAHPKTTKLGVWRWMRAGRTRTPQRSMRSLTLRQVARSRTEFLAGAGECDESN